MTPADDHGRAATLQDFPDRVKEVDKIVKGIDEFLGGEVEDPLRPARGIILEGPSGTRNTSVALSG